jgi:hypothetical protein
MRSFEFCEHFPPFGGRSGASSDPRWARRLIENFAQEGGTLTTTTEDFLNNSYIDDFYRAIITFFVYMAVQVLHAA